MVQEQLAQALVQVVLAFPSWLQQVLEVEEKCEHLNQHQKKLHYNLSLITLTRRGRSRSSFNLLLFNRCWYWCRCRGGFSLLFNWCGRRCTLLSGSLSLSIGLLSSGGCVV